MNTKIPIYPTTNITGTGRRGTLTAPRREVEAVLGMPHRTHEARPFMKVTHEWAFRLDDGTVFTVYDYFWNRPGTYSIGGLTDRAAAACRVLFGPAATLALH